MKPIPEEMGTLFLNEEPPSRNTSLVPVAFHAGSLTLERLFFCKACMQIVVPSERDLGGRTPPDCSLCNVRAQTGLAEALSQGLVRSDEDGFWDVCHPPVPAWVAEEAARPFATATAQEEDW